MMWNSFNPPKVKTPYRGGCIDWRALSLFGMKYQFQLDNMEFVGPVRDRWHEAAMDAVAHGAAFWTDHDELEFTEMGSIVGIVQGSVPKSYVVRNDMA